MLENTRLLLRPITTADAPAMAASLADPEVRRLTGTHAHFSPEQIETYCANIGADPNRLDLAIVDKRQPNRVVGEISLLDIDRTNRNAHLRIALYGKSLFGKGYGTEASRLLIQHAFDHEGLHRIDLEVFSFNTRAVALYRKLGFVQEGVKRQALFWDGAFHDVLLMARLAHPASL
ncbi:GNAT family N-acetyltransferase [Acanthopleuribacter pedis]|uniref:GNAT family N-acetyltransferase n=1 Tax=Acanthopleuribacter pedis TaxID=442870 RepID=A0A8J7Q5H9_9BACT|nr:GNAT family protein [Acanthopleuribacter pedis]MBO1320797.1 GNAT family N-acetyltransferase [Acanthopleuribacter pedis]